MPVDHYENFPVASLLLPAHLRQAVANIYRFARAADDIADEGPASPEARLRALSEFRHALDLIDDGPLRPDILPHPHIFVPLANTMAQHGLTSAYFRDLLSAFEQDVIKHRYADDSELLDYCRRSADPVGRLLLLLYGRHEEDTLRQADAVCTGLQLTNFWQDVAIDWEKGRVYLPADKRARYGVPESWLAYCVHRGSVAHEGEHAAMAAHWQALMAEQVAQARSLLVQGQPLARRLPWRAGLELRIIIQGGLRILERLDHIHYDVFARRPVLRATDWPLMALRALFQ